QPVVELVRLRPGLVARYDAELPGARAAIHDRLMLAVRREALPVRDPAENGPDPAALVRAWWPRSDRARVLAAELDGSVANLALARAAQDGTPAGEPEHLVVDGHPTHPCCRTRTGMTVADVLAYAPEHRPVFRLRRLRVPPRRWSG